jgi:hypothetical protein
MPSISHDAMNQAIRQARADPVDFSDHQAVNRALREASGRQPRDAMAGLPPPPTPDREPATFRRWADAAHAAGMDADTLARWTMAWAEAHRQHLADRRADR